MWRFSGFLHPFISKKYPVPFPCWGSDLPIQIIQYKLELQSDSELSIFRVLSVFVFNVVGKYNLLRAEETFL